MDRITELETENRILKRKMAVLETELEELHSQGTRSEEIKKLDQVLGTLDSFRLNAIELAVERDKLINDTIAMYYSEGCQYAIDHLLQGVNKLTRPKETKSWREFG